MITYQLNQIEVPTLHPIPTPSIDYINSLIATVNNIDDKLNDIQQHLGNLGDQQQKMKQIIKERQQEMEQSLKNTEQNLEATKKNFDQTSQQFNTILTVLLACNPSLADFLDKAKQPQQESQ